MRQLCISVFCLLFCWPAMQAQPMAARLHSSLIVYFSWSGNCARIAAALHRATGGKLLRIEPQMPYSDSYIETLLRARAEKSAIYERAAYPAICPLPAAEIAGCDTLFVCYPLWLGKVAMPMQSFLYHYGTILAAKVVIPVCSSGKSNAAKTQPDLYRLCPTARWQEMLSIERSEAEQTEERVAGWAAQGFRQVPAAP